MRVAKINSPCHRKKCLDIYKTKSIQSTINLLLCKEWNIFGGKRERKKWTFQAQDNGPVCPKSLWVCGHFFSSYQNTQKQKSLRTGHCWNQHQCIKDILLISICHDRANVCKMTGKIIKWMCNAMSCVPLLRITADNTFQMCQIKPLISHFHQQKGLFSPADILTCS